MRRALGCSAVVGMLAASLLTATAPSAGAHDCKVNLDVSDSRAQGAKLPRVAVPEADEETRGAFTVLNENDTDGNGIKDVLQSPMNGEVDLIRLDLKQTTPSSPLALLGIAGAAKVKVWDSAAKNVQLLPLPDSTTWAFAGLPKTVFVEGVEVSAGLRDITFTMVGTHLHPQPPPAPPPLPTPCGFDTATATVVWTELTEVRHDAVEVSGTWADLTDPPRTAFDERCGGGLGLRPIANAPIGVHNCIGFQFRVLPAGIGDEKNVVFDVTRQKHQRWWEAIRAGSRWRLTGCENFPPADKPNDQWFDDGAEIDSSKKSTADDHLYSMDAPGPVDDNAVNNRLDQRWNFREYVRVRFDGQAFIGGKQNEGSRSSDKIDWRASHRLVSAGSPAVWTRTTGDAVEVADTNEVGPGHRANINVPPDGGAPQVTCP